MLAIAGEQAVSLTAGCMLKAYSYRALLLVAPMSVNSGRLAVQQLRQRKLRPTKQVMQQDGHKPVVLSIPLLRHWHSRLNAELFKGELRHIRLTSHTSERVGSPAYGYYSPDEQVPYINIDPLVVTKGMFIATMAHEMVHQLQHQRNLPLTHGRFFKAQAKKALRYGVTL